MSMTGIVGVGYVGQRLLSRLKSPVWLMSRNPETCAAWRQDGHISCCGDLDQVNSLPPWNGNVATLFYLAPPQAGGVEDRRMLHFLHWISASPPQSIVYVSTTGVYGDCHGEWVDEQSPLNPGSDRALKRVSAERQLQTFADEHSLRLVTLRVPGIYGPGRLPLQRLKQGEPVLCPEQAPWSNRIHVEDLVACCIQAMSRSEVSGVFNVADDEPSTMTDYLYAVADAFGITRPPCVDMERAQEVMSEGMLSYLRESRRVSNHRMRTELGVNLRYPSLREGLAEVAESR